MDAAEAAKRTNATMNKLFEMYCGNSTAAGSIPTRHHAMVDFGSLVEEKLKASVPEFLNLLS